MGEQLEVVEGRRGEVIVRGENDRRRPLPLEQADKFSIYERDRIEVCKGERLRVTINTRSADGHPLNNGDAYTVRGFSRDGEIVLNNGWRLREDFPHLAYGYANTSHSAQSKSIDVILVAQSGLISSGATDAKQFYTAVSRGKESPRIYTEEVAGLRENVARVRKRELATEIVLQRTRQAEEQVVEATPEEPKGEKAMEPVRTDRTPARENNVLPKLREQEREMEMEM